MQLAEANTKVKVLQHTYNYYTYIHIHTYRNDIAARLVASLPARQS